jgi:GcrA cell cycle regulator
MDKRYGFNWDTAAIERLKILWKDGYSASEVGAFLGVSRNSVIGKLHRLGLTGMRRRRTRPEGSKAPRMRAPKPVRRPQPQIPQMRTDKRPPGPLAPFTLSLLELGPRHCKWPSEGDAPWTFCGAERLEGLPYCGAHHQRAHQGPQHRALRPIESYAIRRSRQAA